MESVQVDNTPISYRCGRVLDLDGLITCRGILVFQPGQLMQRCEECCTWLGVGADHLTPLSVQTGAATGARDKWTISLTRNVPSFRNAFALECGIPGCHFRRYMEAYRVHASAVNAIIDEHPCPQPKPEEPKIEALPMAEEKEPGPDEYQ
jgi:hypothetical protein